MTGGTGGWRQKWPLNLPAAGFQKDGWKGIGWAPVSGALAKRKFWVVEGVPKDRYYLYGRVELWIDAESWIGAWNRKYSWKGEALNTYQVYGYLNHPAPTAVAGRVVLELADRVAVRRGAQAAIAPPWPDCAPDADLPFDRRVKLPVDQLFDVNTLSRFGK